MLAMIDESALVVNLAVSYKVEAAKVKVFRRGRREDQYAKWGTYARHVG
jgi:hypothetical protein